MNLKLRKIRSFVRRKGHFSHDDEILLDQLLLAHGFRYQEEQECSVAKIISMFSKQQPLCLEIGFGMGHALVEMALNNPEHNYLGIEVHKPGILRVLKKIESLSLTNLRVIEGDAVEVMKHGLADEIVDMLYLFFPDPWPKSRHHKRRIIQPNFVELVAKKLKRQGVFHLATDWENYAFHMLDVISQNPDFENLSGYKKFSHRPNERPLTKFEQRGLNLGYQVFDLVFKKV